MEKADYKQQLVQIRREGRYRQMRVLSSPAGRTVRIEGEEKLNFCSNNYLSLANDKRILQAIQKGVQVWGYGSGGSRLICGNAVPQENLQKRLAQMLGKEACLIMPSGYATNHSILSTLPQKGDMIAIDKLVHASIIDGARSSEAMVRTWPHRNGGKLKR